MDSKDRPLFKSPRAIRHWMAQNEDSPMEPVGWDDSAQYIEDRNHQGASQYFRREARSRWAGDLPRPTFVYGVNAPLGGPIPRFGGFGVVENYPGDNPGHTKIRTGASGTQEEGTSFERGVGGYVQNRRSGSVTTSSSEDSRRFEGNSGHDEELRQRAMTSRDRERFADKPYWENGQRIRADTRRHPYNNYESGARTRGFSSTEHGVQSQRAEYHPPPPTLRQARTGLPDPTRTIDTQTSTWLLGDQTATPNPSGRSGRQVRRQSNMTTALLRTPAMPPAEEERIARTREKPLAAGNIKQAYNLISFLDAGQQEAFELYSIIVGNLAAYPRTFRTEGEAHLMRFQQDIDRAMVDYHDGRPTPSAPRAAPQPVQIPARHRSWKHAGPRAHRGTFNNTGIARRSPKELRATHERGYGTNGCETVPDAAAPSGYGLTYTFGTASRSTPNTRMRNEGTSPSPYDTTPRLLGRSAPNVEDARPAAAGDSDSGTTWRAGYAARMDAWLAPWGTHRTIGCPRSPHHHRNGAQRAPDQLAPESIICERRYTAVFSVEGLYEIILRVGEYLSQTSPLNTTTTPPDGQHHNIPGRRLCLGWQHHERRHATKCATQVPHRNVLQHAPVPSAGIGGFGARADGWRTEWDRCANYGPSKRPGRPENRRAGQTPEGGNE
ncbi:hypothetical protein C8F04DRAFT_1189311 [Mycena alexandri]|uniref:Uncharacterized protein n=1 Tax=Mycena alexandri TaxID=1745969 RepID=A0AAD6WY72_9AGAR|nr:hypothetical protein C8F04DRAFT_1189311 [Mycena alexandri]